MPYVNQQQGCHLYINYDVNHLLNVWLPKSGFSHHSPIPATSLPSPYSHPTTYENVPFPVVGVIILVLHFVALVYAIRILVPAVYSV